MAGYQSLGSAPNAASEFGTSVTQAVGTLTWLRGQHVVKAGADLRWSRLNVVQPPSPTGSFQFSSLFTDLPGTPGTGPPLASFLLGQVQAFSIDFQQDAIRNRAHVQEYFVQDDWRVSDRITVNAGLRYTLNFPSVEANNQAAVFDLESRHIVFLGRDDDQVKLRGFRIELGEIEAGLYRHPAIKEAAVIAVADADAAVSIVAFLSWHGDQRPSLIEIKRFCAENLPLSMLPDRFSWHESLPKTSTDKVDYQRLKDMA